MELIDHCPIRHHPFLKSLEDVLVGFAFHRFFKLIFVDHVLPKFLQFPFKVVLKDFLDHLRKVLLDRSDLVGQKLYLISANVSLQC
jgi:hypothetical protein